MNAPKEPASAYEEACSPSPEADVQREVAAPAARAPRDGRITPREALGPSDEGHHPSGPRLVLSSLAAFPGLAARGRLRLSRERLGRSYRLCDGLSYRVFRETVTPLPGERRAVIEVGFRLKIIRSAMVPHWLFQGLCILTTPFWSGFEGFGTKLWMVDPHTCSYAGIYEWSAAGTARTYLDVLLPVLRVVSVRGSVFSKVHPDAELPGFLRGREPGPEAS